MCNYKSFKTRFIYKFNNNEKQIDVPTVFTWIVTQGTIIFLHKNKDKNLQIVPHCDIIWGCTTIKYYIHVYTTITILNIAFLLTINDNSYNSSNYLQLCNTWGSYIQDYMNAQYRWALRIVS